MPANSVVHFMKIILLSLGNIDLPYLKDGISYYEKKLSHYTKLELLELTLNKNIFHKQCQNNYEQNPYRSDIF